MSSEGKEDDDARHLSYTSILSDADVEEPKPYCPGNIPVTMFTTHSQLSPPCVVYTKFATAGMPTLTVKVKPIALRNDENVENSDDEESYCLPDGVDCSQNIIDGYYFADKFDFSRAMEGKEYGFRGDTGEMINDNLSINFADIDMKHVIEKICVSQGCFLQIDFLFFLSFAVINLTMLFETFIVKDETIREKESCKQSIFFDGSNSTITGNPSITKEAKGRNCFQG